MLIPESTTTWPDLLRRLAIERPEALAYTFLSPLPTSLTFGELDLRAREIAALLQTHAKKGDRALLLYPPGLEYIAGFFGCLYAGVVAVPAYPPDRARAARTLPRIQAIALDAQATLALTTEAILKAGDLEAVRKELDGLKLVATDSASNAEAFECVALGAEDVALLQYSSGSTSTPSGIVLTHRNMIHNAEIQRRAWSLTPDSIGVSWLPLYHDLGVISCLLQPVYVGFHTVMMSPADFIQKPLRWLEAIARYQGTFAGGPNFAFELAVKNTTPDQRAALDLRSWVTAFNGAEPIRPESLEQFADAFAASGFEKSALYPCYGLAEANFVTGMKPGAGATIGRFQTAGLEQGNVAVAVEGEKSRAIVSCGLIPPEHTLAIVDPETHAACAPGRVGEVWLSSPSVGRGTWGRPDASEALFGAKCSAFGDARFLRTGDLGFIDDGHLYLTGRLKDLIIIRGANHYPQDIERTVERASSLMRAGCGAAFSVERDGVERVVVVHEVQKASAEDLDRAMSAARAAILREHEIAVAAIVLLRAGSIHKTTSGKIQRRACKAAFLEGALEAIAEWGVGSATASASASAPAPAPASAPAPARTPAEIEAWIIASLSRQLDMDPRHIDAREPLATYGLDSLAATELTGALETWLGRKVATTAAYEYPTIDALAKHLATGLAPISWTPPGAAGHPERKPADEPIAIIGIGCRFPKSDSPAAFWSLLRDGVDAVSEVPASRWNAARVYDTDPTKAGKTNSRWGGFLDQVDGFDSLFFGISPREARQLDPQQRILLEVAWEALEDAGQVPDALRGSATGVFLGMTTDDYGRMAFNRPAAIDMYSATGTLNSVAAGRISYVFDFRGPSLAIDTACSSSLVAIHYACQSLWNGEATLALAGGSNVMLTPENGISQTKLGALAADGRCKAFDDRADGFVRGEGVGLVILKRLSQAVADGDRIYAVIRGSAVNQDGRSNGLTAPNPQAQRAVLRDAYRHAGISPGSVQYVEAHGTGTPLGDPMELHALGRVLATDRAVNDACAVGSVKTNIGHLESAAGVAGLIKTALALHHESLPASLHFEKANPLIPFDKLGIRVNDRFTAWPRGEKPRYAGVSAFGIGGTNAHVVLGDAPVRAHVDVPEPTEYVLPISARSRAALVARASSYASALRTGALRDASLASVCITAATRRGHLEHRACAVGRDREELLAHLDALVCGEKKDISGLAALYVRGEDVDFTALYPIAGEPVTLPAYAWQRARHWLEERTTTSSDAPREGGSQHPLLDRHMQSASGEHLWEVDVSRDSHGFMQDHVLGGTRVFAGLAYVEMALAAASVALGAGPFAATEIEFLAALFVPDVDPQTIQLSMAPGGVFRVHSRAKSSKGPWVLHAQGRVVTDATSDARTLDAAIAARCSQPVSGDAFYETLRASGTEYGPRFRGAQSITRRDGEALGEITVPASLEPELSGYLFHPALLDACAQIILATRASMHPFMPVRIEKIRLHAHAGAQPRGSLRSHAEAAMKDDALRGDIRVYDGEHLAAEILGARLQLLDRMQRPSAAAYDLAWTKKDHSAKPPVRRAPVTWLLCADRDASTDALAARMTVRGDRCVVAAPGDDGVRKALKVARDLASKNETQRLWIVTRGARAVGDEAGEVRETQAALWGFSRTLAAECPRIWGGIVDLDGANIPSKELAFALEHAIDETDPEDQVAMRGGQRYVARIVRRSGEISRASVAIRGDGAYLITGGLGGLGLKVARRLVDRGARHLVLMGRTPLPPRDQWDALEGEALERVTAIREIESLGAAVHLAAVDVADDYALGTALDRFTRETSLPIRGVVHAAGVGRLRAISELTEADLAADFDPKARGAKNLDRLLADAPLDFFVLYSSLSAVLPSPRMAGYAAANAFLEGLARNRRARGKPALCIHWGMWGETGMAARAQKENARGEWKVGSLTTREALDLQERLLEENATSAIVTCTDWSALGPSPLLSSLVPSTAPSIAPASEAKPTIDRASLTPFSLATYLKTQIEDVLALDAGSLDEAEPLDAVGYDSLTAVDLQIRIAKEMDLDVPLLALLQRGSVRDLAQRIAKQLQSTGSSAPPPAVEAPEPARRIASVDDATSPREISASLSMYPARTPTLPPATHTNSYALGGRDVILVEPATPFEAEQRAWIEWVRGLAASGRKPIALFATHHHDDHVGGLDVLSRELGVPVWMHRETWQRVGGEKPGRLLEDGDVIRLDGPVREEWTALHTPGHAPGHVCLWNAATKTIVAGDMIASVGSILIAPGDGDMQSYVRQLDRLANLGASWALPAHGAPVHEPTAMFRQYIKDRETRERSVLSAVADAGKRGDTAEKLVRIAYRDAPVHTLPFGLLSLRSHLEKLEREGRVVENDGVYRICG